MTSGWFRQLLALVRAAYVTGKEEHYLRTLRGNMDHKWLLRSKCQDSFGAEG